MMDSFPKIGGFSPPNHALNVGFSVINHPFWVPLFLETRILITIIIEIMIVLLMENSCTSWHGKHRFIYRVSYTRQSCRISFINSISIYDNDHDNDNNDKS